MAEWPNAMHAKPKFPGASTVRIRLSAHPSVLLADFPPARVGDSPTAGRAEPGTRALRPLGDHPALPPHTGMHTVIVVLQ